MDFKKIGANIKVSILSIRVITITGEIATGKSTIASALLAKLPTWYQANTGKKFREICANRGVSIQEVSYLPDEIHREVDEWQQQQAETETNLIIEGRLAGWLTRDMPHVFRVYCYSSLDVRVERYVQREKVSEEEARKAIDYRDSRDVLKYQQTYQLEDYRDPSYYSLLLDTSEHSPEALAQIILEHAHLVEQTQQPRA